MARELVASYSIVPHDSGVVLQSVARGMWSDRLGGFLVVSGAGSTATGDVWLVKADGRAFRIGQRGMNFTGMGWSYDDKLWFRSQAASGHYQIDAPALVGGAQYTDAGLFTGVQDYAVMSNRMIFFDGWRVRQWPLPSGTATTECVIVSSSAGPGGRIFPADLSGGKSLWWLATPSTGLLYQYNALTTLEDTSKRSSFASAFACAGYSRKHDLFAVIRGSSALTLDLYANKPAAYALAAPVFSPSPSAGKTSALSAALTGFDGEPCPDRLITFGVDAGTLDRATVLTGSDGVARTTYRAPYSAIAGRTVTATLTE